MGVLDAHREARRCTANDDGSFVEPGLRQRKELEMSVTPRKEAMKKLRDRSFATQLLPCKGITPARPGWLPGSRLY